MWIPARQRWPNIRPVAVNIQTQWVTGLRRLCPGPRRVYFIMFTSERQTVGAVYTPDRCVLCGTGSRDSGPSQRTSPERRNKACRHFSLHCLGWVERGWKWDLQGEKKKERYSRGEGVAGLNIWKTNVSFPALYHLTIWSCTGRFSSQSSSLKYGKWPSLFPWSQHRPQRRVHRLWRNRKNRSLKLFRLKGFQGHGWNQMYFL